MALYACQPLWEGFKAEPILTSSDGGEDTMWDSLFEVPQSLTLSVIFGEMEPGDGNGAWRKCQDPANTL
jgi:hypothetical protein